MKPDSSSTKYGMRPLPTLIFSSRWLQLPLYLGLIVAQGVYVVLFVKELWHLVILECAHELGPLDQIQLTEALGEPLTLFAITNNEQFPVFTRNFGQSLSQNIQTLCGQHSSDKCDCQLFSPHSIRRARCVLIYVYAKGDDASSL